MVRHFGDSGVNNMQPVILEKVRSDPFIRKAREQFYIDLLETEINLILDVNRLNQLLFIPAHVLIVLDQPINN